jgi:hypothetical protein
MTDKQWEKLLAVINGEVFQPLPVGFIIDSPWFPQWAGISALDYFTSEQMWFEANLKAVRQFPDIIFVPAFKKSIRLLNPTRKRMVCCRLFSIGSSITKVGLKRKVTASDLQSRAAL